jgi:hypothetical protein
MDNITNEEIERYLAVKIDSTITVKDADAPSFVRWLLRLANGLTSFNSTVSEIGMMARGYPGKKMDDMAKIMWMKKLEAIGVTFS